MAGDHNHKSSAVSGAEFRDAMSRWCSGVSVVTVEEGGVRHGMTVSAFTSVSVDPPTILVSLQNDARTATLLPQAKKFAVSILSASQAHISNRFAGMDNVEDRFEGIDIVTGESGLPMIDGALARLECRLAHQVSVNDHTIFFGSVESVNTEEVDPLLYYQSNYPTIVYSRRKKPR